MDRNTIPNIETKKDAGKAQKMKNNNDKLSLDVNAFAENSHAYLEKGMSPLPIVPGEKRPAINKWSRYCNEFASAAELESLIKNNPGAGLGLALGTQIPGDAAKHLFAVDIDQDDLVTDVEKILFANDANRSCVSVSKIGKRGLTFFAIAGADVPCRKINNALGMGVEILANGNQTVIPPTVHPEGMQYKWVNDISLLEVDLAKLPVIDIQMVLAIETLVNGRATASSVPDAVNDNMMPDLGLKYLGDGNWNGVDIVYPGNVHISELSMSAMGARWNFINSHHDEHHRQVVIDGILKHVAGAVKNSGSNENWDLDKEAAMVAHMYDGAIEKYGGEWTLPKVQNREPGREKLIELACELELWHTSEREAWVRVPVKGHHENYDVKSKSFRHWLGHIYYLNCQSAPSRQSLDDAIEQL
ncbi:MAG: bifunctional DNA primase/polymerase, partial [Rhodospirillales bacterium]|nr:bifunctional DNA primase/polymerase [Rhodospirillales bacterium]